MLNKADWIRVGDIIYEEWNEWTFVDGKDVYGKKFKVYSKKYGEMKRTGKLRRQASQYKNTTIPILTGDLMNDFGVKGATGNGVKIGWTSQGAKIDFLFEVDRVISSDFKLLPDPVDVKAQNYISIAVDKKLGPNETKTITI